MRLSFLRFIAVCSLLLLPVSLSTTANAVTLVSNLTSSVDGSFGGSPDSADSFLTGNTGLDITSIDILWELGEDGTSNRVGIFTEALGVPSLTQVGGFFTSATATITGSTINYVGAASLAANTVYWMVVEIFDESQVAFSFNQLAFSDPTTQGATILGSSTAYGSLTNGSWAVDSANLLYALNGNASVVPVPAALPLFGTGLAFMGFMGWRRKRKLAVAA